jgi:replication factor C large subunit
MSWVQKYKPKTLGDVVGNEDAKNKILDWICSWNKGIPKKRALLIHGPPGVGKTVSVEALANDLNLELIQSNASDYRTEEAVKRFAGRASENATLFGRRRLILFDELDGITGSADRGGLHEIMEIAKKTRVPMILIANNAYDPRFATLRSHCWLIEFKKPTKLEVVKHLKRICFSERIEAEEASLMFIAEMSGGDVRSAVNDLQALAQGSKQLTCEDVSWLASRDRKEAIFNVLRNILYARDSSRAKEAIDMADVDPDMLYEWVYENLPYHVKNPKELAEAMYMLARADIYRRRVKSTQNWSLIRYFFDLMTAGVAASWSKKSTGWVPLRFPTRIGSLSRSKSEREMLVAIGMKIEKRCHISASRAINEVLPYMRIMFQSSPEVADGLAKWLDLDEEMKDYIAKKE